MKNKNIIVSMFDDTEPYMPSQQQEEGIANTQDPLAETEKSDTYGYLQKLLELERKITTTQERQIEIQAEQRRLSAQLQDSCKNFKVSLSEEDKKLIEDMPENMAKEFGRYKAESAEFVNNIINRHKESTIKNFDATCEAKIEKTRKEMGEGRGIYLSWPNFWAMFLTTIVCISYTIYTAFNQCLWDEIWERIWLPLLVFVGMCGCLALIFWLNIKEGGLPKL
jgi:hypothetical protein